MLANNHSFAWRVAVEHLGVGWAEFDEMTPLELSWRLWGERRRRNRRAMHLSWAVSSVMAPHLSKSDQGRTTPRALFFGLTSGQLDEDEIPD